MSALYLLFSRKAGKRLRQAFILLDLEPDRKDLTERLYQLYLALILAGLGLFALAYIVVTLATNLARFNLPVGLTANLLILGLGLWLAVTPGLAARSFDLFRFELADLDFLANAPLPVPLVTLVWFARTLFSRVFGIFILVSAVLASTLSYMANANEWLGLGLGLFAGANFYIIALALRWLTGLLQYRPRPLFKGKWSYLIIAAGLVLLALPFSELIFWPAGLAAWLMAGQVAAGSPAGGLVLGMAGLFTTTLLSLLLLYRAGRAIGLAPAFEEGRLGGQYRLAAGSKSIPQGEAYLQFYLTRKFMKGRSGFKPARFRGLKLTGTPGGLVFKQWLRLNRLPPYELLFIFLSSVVSSAGFALMLANQDHTGLPFSTVLLAVFGGNRALVRFGSGFLKRELAHPDFFVSWPLSRLRLVSYLLLLGFALPFAGGEVGLALGGLAGLNWATELAWMLLWPLLLGVTLLLTLYEYLRQFKNWSGGVDNLPETGNGIVIAALVIWLLTLLSGPWVGIGVAGLIVVTLVVLVQMGPSRQLKGAG